jgi:cephalosporin-C deacetylase-like acetyl esterase
MYLGIKERKMFVSIPRFKSVLFFIVMAVCICRAEVIGLKTDRDNAMYNISETAMFEVSSTAGIDFDYELTLDGGPKLAGGTMRVEDKPIKIEGTLDKPGFLKCTLKYTDPESGKIVQLIATAGFDLEKIKPAFDDVPYDFDSFWMERKAELACIPMEPVMKKIASSDPNIEIFDVQIKSIGLPVSGYYARPINAKVKSSPAILFVQGAGVNSASAGWITQYANLGFIALEINAHGLPNGKDSSYYDNLFSGKLSSYWEWGKESPYTSYFTGMYIRVIRALEFLKSQPQWDGKVLVTYGSSQGGSQALAGAGLDSDVNIVMASVPAMCDHSGIINGWPRFVPIEKDGTYNKQISDASRYVDSVNFSRRTNAYGIFIVGFIDTTCRPTSVYAAFNSFKGDKEMINKPLMTHTFPYEDSELVKRKILARVKILKQGK